MGRIMSKKSDDIVVSSLGASTTGVTGSCWSCSYKKDDGTRGLVVIECGLTQSEPTIDKQYNANKNMVDTIGKDIIQSADYVLLGHSHIDHLGNLPIFNDANGFSGKILASKETIEIGKELIKDSVYIHSKNIKYLKSKGKKCLPLYTEKQMYNMFDHMEYAKVNEKIKLDDNLTIEFRYNSHTIGSTNITLIFKKPNNSIKTIVYSSDMGSAMNKDASYYLQDQDIPKQCNLFISEATYCQGNRQISKKLVKKEREDLKNTIKQAIMNKQRVLLPTFAFSRSQLLLTYLYEWFHDEEWFRETPVVVDGVLMNNINSVYRRVLQGEDKKLFEDVMNWKNVKFNKSYDSTIAFLTQRTPSIILASSGFLENGRIVTYLPIILGCSKDIIITTGYCGGNNPSSMGFKLLDKEQNTITVDKRVILKRAEIKSYSSFSSHISHDELLELWSQLNCDKILVHHADEKGKMEFIAEANDYLRSKNKTTKIVPVNKGANQFIL